MILIICDLHWLSNCWYCSLKKSQDVSGLGIHGVNYVASCVPAIAIVIVDETLFGFEQLQNLGRCPSHHNPQNPHVLFHLLVSIKNALKALPALTFANLVWIGVYLSLFSFIISSCVSITNQFLVALDARYETIQNKLTGFFYNNRSRNTYTE